MGKELRGKCRRGRGGDKGLVRKHRGEEVVLLSPFSFSSSFSKKDRQAGTKEGGGTEQKGQNHRTDSTKGQRRRATSVDHNEEERQRNKKQSARTKTADNHRKPIEEDIYTQTKTRPQDTHTISHGKPRTESKGADSQELGDGPTERNDKTRQ